MNIIFKIMEYQKTKYFVLVFALIGIFSCSSDKEKDGKSYSKAVQKKEEIKVKTAEVKKDNFELELVSNGKAVALRKAVVNFIVGDIIEKVVVSNGQRVKKGQVLACVDKYKSEQALYDADLSVRKAMLDLESQLISSGYTFKDTANIPKRHYDIMKLRSGYISAKNNYTKALREYNNTMVKAPFSGVIADLEAKEFNHSSAYKNLCTLIDDSKMEIDFEVLETEISYLKKGMKVEASPFANQSIKLVGVITEVNPRIDENGMVGIKALIDNKGAHLVDGMNVSLLIKRDIENKLIIPKSAVLARQGKKVVFVYKDGKAIWKYVTTGYENSKMVSIEKGLKAGEEVIYENNLGLSHEAVVVKERG